MVTLIPAPRFVCLWGYDRSLENRTKCVDINKLYVKLTTRWMPLSESSINFYLRFKTNHSTSLIVFLSFFLSFFLSYPPVSLCSCLCSLSLLLHKVLFVLCLLSPSTSISSFLFFPWWHCVTGEACCQVLTQSIIVTRGSTSHCSIPNEVKKIDR